MSGGAGQGNLGASDEAGVDVDEPALGDLRGPKNVLMIYQRLPPGYRFDRGRGRTGFPSGDPSRAADNRDGARHDQQRERASGSREAIGYRPAAV
jgi:hypothetical protein